MNARQKRRLKAIFDKQIEQERNGAPVPAEIAERMTKPRISDEMFQVNVTARKSGKVVPFGPKWTKDAAGALCEAINRAIIEGKELSFTKAEVVPLNLIRAGA